MKPEQRGQLFILETLIDGVELIPADVYAAVHPYMSYKQASESMQGLYSSENITTVEPETKPRDAYIRANKQYRITEIGINYCNFLREERDIRITDNANKYFNTQNAKRVYRNYTLNQIILWTSFAISLGLAILKLVELAKK
ncbi:MAG TPA: hypothetical protein VEV83_15745 [Parafilimonas sp.]|nr:hypothetical protein [Parafilimonas sp.]